MTKDIELIKQIESAIVDVPDFPKTGIVFKDITNIFLHPQLCSEIVDEMATQVEDWNITKIAGIESRGFLLGMCLAQKMNLPFVLIRKLGKLPRPTISQSYNLEYGTATIELHTDALNPDDNVLIHDDLLATGGTAGAAAQLIKQKANIAGFSFLVELEFLKGRNLVGHFSKNISSLIGY